MKDAANFEGVGSGANEEEPIVADAQPEFISSLEGLYVALAGIREAMQGGENAHGGGLVQVADIGLGGVRPEDALHERLKREVSLERLAEARGVKLVRHGADLIGLCPFHDTRASNNWQF